MIDFEITSIESRRRAKAVIWFTRRQSAVFTSRRQKYWKAWRAIPENQRAFNAIEKLWQVLEDVPLARRAAEHARSERPSMRGSSKVTWVDFKWWKGSSYQSAKSAETRRRWQPIGLVVTATAAMMVAAGYLGERVFHVNANSAGRIYWRTEKLEDGTGLVLGARSEVRVDFTPERRVVHHLGGEVMFDVAEDTARPFVVSTFLVDVTGGTKFGVVVDTTVTVTAQEGIVRVSVRGAKPGSSGIIVKGGHSYRVPVDGFRSVVAADGGGGARMRGSSG